MARNDGDGDDTTTDPLFKNVPRRPRSAALRPRNEEPDGGDPGGGINGAPPATTSVASNKRPLSSTGGGGAAEHVPRAKKHRLVVPSEEPEPEAYDRGVVILGGMPPALSHRDKAAAAAAASSASGGGEGEAAVDWAEKERSRKGKRPVVDGGGAHAAVARRPPAGKLLGDAIRSHGSTAVAGFQPPPKKPRAKPKKEEDPGAWFWCGMGRDGTSSAGSDVDYSFDRIGVASDRLRTTLRGLGVAAPVRLYGRFLTRCDRDNQQTRLLMSSKRWRAVDAEFPLCTFLTEEEKERVHGDGLLLTAYDRGGDAYELTFRFLECNTAYRLIKKWGQFLRQNGLVVAAPVDDDVMLDLWMFRLPGPGGKVGMVMLHYRRGDAAHADAALDEMEQKMVRRLMLNNGDAAAAAVMEGVVGNANEMGDEDAGVMGEVAAAAPAPAPPSPSEPSGGGAIEAAKAASSPSEPDGAGAMAAEEQGGAPGEVAHDAPSTSSELPGGAGRSDEATAAPLSLGGDGAEDEEQKPGGALMVMALEVAAAATQSSSGSNAGGAPNEVAAPPPPSSPEAGSGAALMGAEDDEAEAAARSWNVTKLEYEAALGLVMLSRAFSKS